MKAICRPVAYDSYVELTTEDPLLISNKKFFWVISTASPYADERDHSYFSAQLFVSSPPGGNTLLGQTRSAEADVSTITATDKAHRA